MEKNHTKKNGDVVGGAVFLGPFCPTFSRSRGSMTVHAPSAVGVAKAPHPLILFNYIKLQLRTEEVT